MIVKIILVLAITNYNNGNSNCVHSCIDSNDNTNYGNSYDVGNNHNENDDDGGDGEDYNLYHHYF